jgi:ubiquinone/menaquinone biosynthesis C-methylase UbiE
MTADGHHEVTRDSFTKQVGLFTGDQAVFAQPALAWLGSLGSSMLVLDVACGAGHAAELAAPHVRQVVGVDLTRALLALGATRLADSGVDNVLFQEGDALALPFVDDSFDLVFSRSALHHLLLPDVAVREMARVCRPGGRVVVSDMTGPNADLRQAFDGVHRQIDPSHVGVLLESELIEIMRTVVGPVTSSKANGPMAIPLDRFLTEAADRDAVETTLRAEMRGGPATGFSPSIDPADGDRLLVSFTSAVVHATCVVPS